MMRVNVFYLITSRCLLLSFTFFFLFIFVLIPRPNAHSLDLCHLYFAIDRLSSLPISICSTPLNSLLTSPHNITTEAAIQSTYVSALDSLESDDYWLTTSSFTKVWNTSHHLVLSSSMRLTCLYYAEIILIV